LSRRFRPAGGGYDTYSRLIAANHVYNVGQILGREGIEF
jgi:hypothetical protein